MSGAICENCGKKFGQALRKLKINKHNFCSKECYFIWMKSHPDIISTFRKRGPRDGGEVKKI